MKLMSTKRVKASKATKVEHVQTIPEAKEINGEIKKYILEDIIDNHQTLAKLAKEKGVAQYEDLHDMSYIKIYTTKDELTGIITRFSVAEKLKVEDLSFVRVIYSDYSLEDYLRERTIIKEKQPDFIEKYNVFKNRSETLKRIKDKEDKKQQPPIKPASAEETMDKNLKFLYKYADYLVNREDDGQSYEEYTGEKLSDEEDENLTINDIKLRFAQYDRLPKLPPQGVFTRIKQIKNINFDNLFIIGDELYRETKGTTGKDAFKRMGSKENSKGEKTFRVAYVEDNKEKSIILNLTRFIDGKKSDIIAMEC